MVSRSRKLAAAGLTVAVGLLLAWPWRRTDAPLELRAPASAPPRMDAARSLTPPAPAGAPAHMASFAVTPTPETPVVDPEALLQGAPAPPAEAGRPVYAAAAAADPGAPSERSEPRIHVVHNGDTLERLAKRYLGSESRALEIFDRNRDVLENPHLLPIGAELRIPGDAPLP